MQHSSIGQATASTTTRAARSEAERAEREAGQMRSCTPTRSEPPPRDGSIDLAEDPGVPEGQPKSEQAPIRRPPSRAEGHCTGARLTLFSLDRARPVFFSGKTEKKMGVHPRWTSPLREQTPPRPPSGGPHLPGRQIAAPTVPAWVRRKSGGRTHRSAPTVPGRPAHPATNRRSPPGQ